MSGAPGTAGTAGNLYGSSGGGGGGGAAPYYSQTAGGGARVGLVLVSYTAIIDPQMGISGSIGNIPAWQGYSGLEVTGTNFAYMYAVNIANTAAGIDTNINFGSGDGSTYTYLYFPALRQLRANTIMKITYYNYMGTNTNSIQYIVAPYMNSFPDGSHMIGH